MADDDLPPEQNVHVGGDAMGLVFRWLVSVFDEGDLPAVWHLVDDPLRLALAQSWLILEQDRAELSGESLDNVAREFTSEHPEHPLWPEFAHWRTVRWRSVLPRFVTDVSSRGFVSTPALIGVDLEAVLVAEALHAGSLEFGAGEPLEVQRFLVRHTTNGTRLAGIGGVLPIPGWPPSETDRFPS